LFITTLQEDDVGSKKNPGEFDCYFNAKSDEPMFVLLARDITAPLMVRHWANYRESQILMGTKPRSDSRMIIEARKCADDMEEWKKNNP
jgi:hypothetical protein